MEFLGVSAPRSMFDDEEGENDDVNLGSGLDELAEDSIENVFLFLLARHPRAPYLNLSYQDILELDEQEAMIYIEWLQEAYARYESKSRR